MANLQWHKVTDMLPDNSRVVWTNVGAGYHDDDGWWDDYGRLQGVIAWCEPKYEEDEQLTKAIHLIKIMRHLLFDICGYIAIPFEKEVNDFLKEADK